MRTNRSSWIVTACLSALASGFSANPLVAREPTAAELIALAPVIRSSDEKVRSIEVAGYSRADGKILVTFRALYRAPDRFAMIVRDGQDGTPISIHVDKKVMVYDPVRPELLIRSHARGYRILRSVDGKYEDSWGSSWGSSNSVPQPSRIEIDLKSVFTDLSVDDAPLEETVTKEAEGVYVLTRRDDKVYKRLRVDRRGATPVVTYEKASSPGGPPTSGIDRMVVNGVLNDSEFAFPSLHALAGMLDIREVEDGFFSEGDLMNTMARTYYVRQKLHEPPAQRGVIGPMLAGVRWSRVEENDERLAEQIRTLVPPDPIRRVVAASEKADGESVKRTGFDAIRDRLPHLPYKFKVRIDTNPDDPPAVAPR